MLIIIYLLSIFEYQEVGGPSSSFLLSSTIASTYNVSAVNPALLAGLNKNGAGIVYSRPFEISQLQYNRLSLNYKNFGLGVSRLGFIGYQEYILSLATGFNLTPELAYGLIVKGLFLDLATYGQTLIPALNLGASYVIDKINLAVLLENLNIPKSSLDEPMAWQLLCGILLKPVPDFSVGCDLSKSNENQNFILGAEFKPIQEFALRLGIKTTPFIISSGLSVMYQNIQFDYALQFHTHLKQTSIFSLGYFW